MSKAGVQIIDEGTGDEVVKGNIGDVREVIGMHHASNVAKNVNLDWVMTLRDRKNQSTLQNNGASPGGVGSTERRKDRSYSPDDVPKVYFKKNS